MMMTIKSDWVEYLKTWIKYNNYLHIFILLTLRLIFDVLYVKYMHEVWAHKGFDYSWQLLKYIESWLLFLCVAFSLPGTLRVTSDMFVTVIGIAVLLPMTSMYGLTSEPRWIIYSILLGHVVILATRKARLFNIPVISNNQEIPLYLSLFSVCVVVSWMCISGAVYHINFDFSEVYNRRSEVGALINKGFFSYLNGWVLKAFNLFLLAYGLYKKNWMLVAISIVIQIFLFSVIAHKAILFYPILIIFIWLWFRKNTSLTFVPLLIIGVVLISATIWKISGDQYSLMISLVVRRMFYVVANNIYDYYHYFSSNQFIYWSNSLTTRFIEYPYTENYPDLVGSFQAVIVGREGTDAADTYVNSSFLATGYMHAGFLGLILYCFLVGLLFRIVDVIANQSMPIWFAVSIMLIPMFSLISSADLPTALLTHGVIVSILLLLFSRHSLHQVEDSQS